MANYNAKSRGGLSADPKDVLSARYNPKSLTELSANKLEQMIMPRTAKPKSLVQLAAEKIEHSIKQPAQLPKPSKLTPTLKNLAAKALVKNRINYWKTKSVNNDAPIIVLDKKPINMLI